jgi:hypothetical protein
MISSSLDIGMTASERIGRTIIEFFPTPRSLLPCDAEADTTEHYLLRDAPLAGQGGANAFG